MYGIYTYIDPQNHPATDRHIWQSQTGRVWDLSAAHLKPDLVIGSSDLPYELPSESHRGQ